MKRKLILSALCLAALIAVVIWTQAVAPVLADAPIGSGACGSDPECKADNGTKYDICHIAGHEEPDNANEVDLNLPCEGVRGHFDMQGQPLAGHENDHCGPCEKEGPPPCDPATEKCP